MTPKQYLSQYQRAYRTILFVRRELERAEHDAAGIRAIIYSDMPKSHNVEHDLSDAMVRIEELAAKYKAVVTEHTNIMAEVAAVILKVDDKTQREVLWLRYIEGMDFEAIPDMIHYSERQMYSYYGQGLEAVRRILEAEGLQ